MGSRSQKRTTTGLSAAALTAGCLLAQGVAWADAPATGGPSMDAPATSPVAQEGEPPPAPEPSEPAPAAETESETAGTVVRDDSYYEGTDDEDDFGEDGAGGGGPSIIPKPEWLPVNFNFSVGTRASLGQMFRDEYTVTNQTLLSFGYGVSYTVADRHTLSLGGSATKFVTAGGTTELYEGRIGDLSLSYSPGPLYTIPGANIRLTGGLSATIPVSRASRTDRLYTSLGANLGLSRTFFERLTLSYGFGVSKNFNRYMTTVLDSRELDILARSGGNEQLAGALVAADTGILGEWGLSNSLSLRYAFPFGLSTGMSFSLSDSFTYADSSILSDDEFTSPYARPGRGRAQVMSGGFNASYAFLGNFSVSGNLSTSQAPKTADNQRFRFPFFDTQSGNLSYTSVGLTLAMNY